MSGSGLDLGDVGFSLVADTAGLEQALATLRRFGDAVNTWEKKTDEASQRVTSAWMRQEKSMVSMYQKMTSLQSQGRRVGMPTEEIDKATTSLKRHIDTLTLLDKHGNPIARSTLEMQRATASASGEINKFQNKLKDWQAETKRTAQGLKDLSALESQLSKSWGAQLTSNMFPQSGRKAKASAQTFMQAGLMDAPADAHVMAWQKYDAAVRKTTEAYNANANAHVQAYQKQQAAIDALTTKYNANANAHVQAYRAEQQAMVKRDAQLADSTQKAIASARLRTEALIGSAKRSFAPDSMITEYAAALQRFEGTARTGVTNTKELGQAYQKLRADLQKVTQELKDYTAQQNAASRAEKLAQSATTRVRRINESAMTFRLPSKFGEANVANLQAYQGALFAGDSNKSHTAFLALNKSIAETQKEIAKATAGSQKFSSALRGMERATILAMGPLSGLGARMAVMAALFESTSAKAAVLIASATGVGFAVAATASAAVKARIAWEQWNSMLIAASGSIALAAPEFEYVTSVADKYGQAVQELVPSYAKFATSTRLANVSLEDQRKIFESFTTAGAALHWTTEQSGRAFLALEQMMSKGVVQSQEMKLQLGQVLPGALELAAKSAGKTTKEFMKMMEQGEVMTAEFAPKFADTITQVYKEAAKYGAQAIQADINRFMTGKFEVSKAFDDAMRASELFHTALRSVNNTLDYLQKNASTVIATFVSGLATLVAMYIPALIVGLGKVIAHMRTMTVLGAVMSAATSGNILKAIAQIGAMAAVGYTTFKLLDKAMANTTNKTQEVIDKTAIALTTYQELGEISKREKQEHINLLQQAINDTKKRIEGLKAEQQAIIGVAKATKIAMDMERLRAIQKDMHGKDIKKMGFLETWGRTIGSAAAPQTLYETPAQVAAKTKKSQAEYVTEKAANTPAGKLKAATDAAQTELARLEKIMADFNALTESKDPSKDKDKDKDDKLAAKFENTHNAIAKLFTDLDQLEKKQVFIDAQFKIGPISAEEMQKAMDRAEAQKAVADFFEGMKDKTKATFITKLEKEFKGLFAMHGIEGGSLEDRLVRLHMRLKENERAVNDSAETLKNWSEAAWSAAVKAQEFENALADMKIGTNKLTADFTNTADSKALDRFNEDLKKKHSVTYELWDKLLDIPNLSGNAFAEQLGRAETAIAQYSTALDTAAEKDFVSDRLSESEAIISSLEQSMQSRIVAGVETETSARRKLTEEYRRQGATLAKDVIPRTLALMETYKDNPAVLTALQAIIDKIKELQALGEKFGADAGLKQGFKDYAAEAADAFEKAREFAVKAFKGIEDSLVELAMTGKLTFKDMANSIIEDMIRIMIQQSITKPLAQAAGNMGSAAMSAAASWFFGSAQGNAFSASPGLSAYANTVVTKPTVFPFANGGVGLMGEESGTPGEAIMPLTRAGNGDLAVRAVGMKGGMNDADISIQITYNDNRTSAETQDKTTDNKKASQLTTMIKSVVHTKLLEEMRPGGLLA